MFKFTFVCSFICFFLHKISLQSKGGCYECSESKLRWVCKDKVRLRYQFCSWEEHQRKPVCANYMPAGPLLDITVIAGKLEEVHLPHWIGGWYNQTASNCFNKLKWKEISSSSHIPVFCLFVCFFTSFSHWWFLLVFFFFFCPRLQLQNVTHVRSSTRGHMWRFCRTSVWSYIIARQDTPTKFFSMGGHASNSGLFCESFLWCSYIQDKKGVPNIARLLGPTWWQRPPGLYHIFFH